MYKRYMKGFGSYRTQRLRTFHQNEAHRESIEDVATCSMCAFLPFNVKFLFGYYINLSCIQTCQYSSNKSLKTLLSMICDWCVNNQFFCESNDILPFLWSIISTFNDILNRNRMDYISVVIHDCHDFFCGV